MAEWFVESGYTVWMASYETSTISTPRLAANGDCLRNQLAEIYGLSGGRPLTIVAHSMGGLVSRAALHGANFEVEALVTLGSPHGGMPIDFLAKMPGFLCQLQPGACELAFEVIPVFNGAYPNLDSTDWHAWFGPDILVAQPPGRRERWPRRCQQRDRVDLPCCS
jgi:pimeloyl-ACP methyl ester carboxylesterase